MTLTALGLDIAKEKFDAALYMDGKYQHRVFANRAEGYTQLLAWLNQHGVGKVHACMEATGRYGEQLALFLHSAGQVVSVVNPACIKAYAKSQLARNKTDKADALLIARFCHTQEPAAWSPAAAEIRQLQALVRQLEALLEMRQQEANRLHSGLMDERVIGIIHEHLAFLDEQIKQLKRLIQAHIKRHPGLREQQELVTSIPGIGELTAAKLLAELGEINNYESARSLAAQAGLTPRQEVSGSSVRGRARLSKTGNAALRKALYLPAIVAKQHNPVIKAFCERLSSNGKSKMAVIGAAMRKLLHLVYGVLKNGKPFDPHHEESLMAVAVIKTA